MDLQNETRQIADDEAIADMSTGIGKSQKREEAKSTIFETWNPNIAFALKYGNSTPSEMKGCQERALKIVMEAIQSMPNISVPDSPEHDAANLLAGVLKSMETMKRWPSDGHGLDDPPPLKRLRTLEEAVDITRENLETPQPVQAPQPLTRGDGHGVVESTEAPSAPVTIPPDNSPMCSAGTASLTAQHLAPPHLSAPSAPESTPRISPTVDLAVKHVSPPSPPRSAPVDKDYSSFEDLLGALNKMKKFALGQKAGAILFAANELEKHILTAIFGSSQTVAEALPK